MCVCPTIVAENTVMRHTLAAGVIDVHPTLATVVTTVHPTLAAGVTAVYPTLTTGIIGVYTHARWKIFMIRKFMIAFQVV